MAVVAALAGLAAGAEAQGWWNPARQNSYMAQVCGAARTALDLDECQYVAESLIDNLRDCLRNGSPHAAQCAALLPGAEAQLARVNRDPTLLEHREDQRESQRQADIRALCASQNGGYFVGDYAPCVVGYDVDP